MDPRNPYGAPAPLIFKGLAVAIVLGARVQGWFIDWRLVRAEERDARRERLWSRMELAEDHGFGYLPDEWDCDE